MYSLWKDVNKVDFQEVVRRLGVASSGSWPGQLAGSYESSNEPPVSTKCKEFVS